MWSKFEIYRQLSQNLKWSNNKCHYGNVMYKPHKIIDNKSESAVHGWNQMYSRETEGGLISLEHLKIDCYGQ